MNDETRKLNRSLEQATAAERPAPGSLDAETASLREAWLALGQLLETACPASERSLQLPEPPKRAVRAGWIAAAIAALAASLLLAVMLAWSLSGSKPSERIASPETDQLRQDVKDRQQQARSELVENEIEDLQWNDPFDEQLALVGQEIVYVQQDWYDSDDAFGPLDEGPDQIGEDLENGTL